MATHPRNECLAITASGEDRIGLVEKLTSQISASGCNTEQSRMGVPGGNAIARLRDEFFECCDDLNLEASLEPARA